MSSSGLNSASLCVLCFDATLAAPKVLLFFSGANFGLTFMKPHGFAVMYQSYDQGHVMNMT